jgi:hypothetical protein
MIARLKLNGIRSVIKIGGILIRVEVSKGWPRKFAGETFLKWIREAEKFLQKFNEITKIACFQVQNYLVIITKL